MYNNALLSADMKEKDTKDVMNMHAAIMSNTFKNNNYLERALLVGHLRVAQDSIFSGANEIEYHTMNATDYARFFGITQEGFIKLCQELDISEDLQKKAQAYYNGLVNLRFDIYKLRMISRLFIFIARETWEI